MYTMITQILNAIQTNINMVGPNFGDGRWEKSLDLDSRIHSTVEQITHYKERLQEDQETVDSLEDELYSLEKEKDELGNSDNADKNNNDELENSDEDQ